MKLLLLFLFTSVCFAQPTVTLVNGTLSDIEVKIPEIESKKFIDLTKAWVTEAKRSGQVLDMSNVSSGSLTISGYKHNAFNYRERGETHWHDAKVVMQVRFSNTAMSIKITLPELFTNGGKPIQYTLPDYFADGKLKDGYEGLQKSLEENLNRIVRSYYNFIVNYK
nr:hypothetical protein [uncultured Flavobacterium sp.]